MQKFCAVILLLSMFTQTTLALQSINMVNHYYGEKVSTLINSLQPQPIKINKCSKKSNPATNSTEQPEDLKITLHEVVSGAHISEDQHYDILAENCDNFIPQNDNQACKTHRVLGYKNARVELFGNIHLQEKTPNSSEPVDVEDDNFFIKDIYCLKDYTNKDLPENEPMGRNLIPFHEVINTEHVWPQSRFKDNIAKETGPLEEMKKSDLHILYPSDSKVNSLRGNYEFADVSIVTKAAYCSTGKLGYIDESNAQKKKLYFEPPKESKGNIARSLFYFSVRYDVKIDEVEESFLRQWHESDPVDFIELLRNTKIHQLQNVRNPFIDYPYLVKSLKDF